MKGKTRDSCQCNNAIRRQNCNTRQDRELSGVSRTAVASLTTADKKEHVPGAFDHDGTSFIEKCNVSFLPAACHLVSDNFLLHCVAFWFSISSVCLPHRRHANFSSFGKVKKSASVGEPFRDTAHQKILASRNIAIKQMSR